MKMTAYKKYVSSLLPREPFEYIIYMEVMVK
jgi:hypothetical protein